MRNIGILTVVATVATLAWTAPATADAITFTSQPSHAVGPQSSSNPCVIAGTTCQQPNGLAYTNFVNNGSTSSYDEFSPTYTVSQLASFNLLAFNVAIDVNTTNAAGETLRLFDIIVNGSTAF